ncbi:MAG: type II secretion system protein [Chthoniobacterales bacterium]
MTNNELIPECRRTSASRHTTFGIRSFIIPSSFDIRHSSFRAPRDAFTLIELLIVMAIIIVLAGLILATANYVQKKGYRSRAEAEIAAISAALENYKADNGVYPSTAETNALIPNKMGDPNTADYTKASLALYKLISGDANADRTAESKSYLTFKPNQLSPTDQTANVISIRDPFGNSYGYSTVKASVPSGTDGYNPSFDLWSTAGSVDSTTSPNQSQWIKNW